MTRHAAAVSPTGRLICECRVWRRSAPHACGHTADLAETVSALGGPSRLKSPTAQRRGYLYLAPALRPLAR